MTRNEHWLSRSRTAVWHPCTQMKQHESMPLVPISRGSGSWLYDFEGKRYLDAISCWWVNLFGHGHPAIDRKSGERDNFARWFAGEALTREMLPRPIGRTVYWMPPYCLGRDEMEILASRTLEIVACA